MDQNDKAQNSESDEDRKESQHVHPPYVGVSRIGTEQCIARLSPRWVACGAELVDKEEIHAVLEGAKVLRPANPDLYLLHSQEEAREKYLRDKDGRRGLHGLLRAACNTAAELRGRGRGEAYEPRDEQVQAKGAAEVQHPVDDEQGD